MTNVVTLTAAGTATWYPPADCPPGTVVTVETWGAGAGGNGQTGTSFGAAGAGGAYAKSPYTISLHDASSGISYTIGAGSSGGTGSNPSAGGNTSFSTNNLNLHYNSTNYGASLPSTYPNGWYTYTSDTGLTFTLVGFGTVGGLPYIDVNVAGTVTGSSGSQIDTVGGSSLPLCATVASTTYVVSAYTAVVGGSMANLTDIQIQSLSFNGGTFVGSNTSFNVNTTSTLTQTYASFTTAAGTNFSSFYFLLQYNTGAAINVTLRMAALQMELGTTPTFFKGTPGYALAQGGGAPSGNTGGVGSASSSVGFTSTFAGGSGANYNTAGSGGGGAGGKDGAGNAGTTAGPGGQGDATTGGAGGAVKATSPGNPGTANVEGGGGGGGLKTVSGTGGAGAAPGGGGGGAAVASGTGGAGSRGQVRLTYPPAMAPGVVGMPPQIQIWDR